MNVDEKNLFDIYCGHVRTSIFSKTIEQASCSCCGLRTTFGPRPKGAEVIISDKPVPRISTDHRVSHESVKLDNGMWLSCQLFIPESYSDGVRYEPVDTLYDLNKKDYYEYDGIGALVISDIGSYNVKRLVGRYNYNVDPPKPIWYNFDEAPLEHVVKEFKGYQFLAVTTKDYGDWRDKHQVNHLFDIQWESDWFCNRPYLSDTPNYLQLQLVKVL